MEEKHLIKMYQCSYAEYKEHVLDKIDNQREDDEIDSSSNIQQSTKEEQQ